MAHIIFCADYDKKTQQKQRVRKEIVLTHQDPKGHSFHASCDMQEQEIVFTSLWENNTTPQVGL
ncbi:hypothetical protein K6Y31_15180 [Motilimonas cestriensis]|uniref:Uncharacterized protein n=1 Tax=Motilimonas cestriensis TaxID=2742685 RepID=A0ABS8WCD0_9GAMM|nr:hypothetical protein [Motilimonas cestriensis]MCE2596155.1 hypothetical protein [Motilimonas cestriensis]